MRREPSEGASVMDWLPRRGKWLGPSAVASAFLIGGVAASSLLSEPVETAAPEASAPLATSTAARAVTPAPPAPPAPRETAIVPPSIEPKLATQAPGRGPARTPPSDRRARPAEAVEAVEISLTSEPAGAQVSSPFGELGTTPLGVLLPTGRKVTLTFTLEGHLPARIVWSGRATDRALHVALKPGTTP
ncbi:MAG: hypothetical protein IT384_07725 [Deltaproteobacteria bacterium]|nr:hypothetical protein [Deltaproteobacteria bacterium]